MIARLQGQLISKQPPWLMLDVGGVGYELEAPMSTFYDLPESGQDVVLHTHLIVREDAHSLYGFLSVKERQLFRDLLKINGIGAKVALAVLSTLSTDDFIFIVQAQDVTGLTRVPGIGKKTAERMLVELKDKVDELGVASISSGSGSQAVDIQADAGAEAMQALVALGYKPADASKMIGKIRSDADTTEALIKLALQSSVNR